MADDTPSVASHTSVLAKIINAIMHLASTSPSGGGPAVDQLRQAQMEVQAWTPQPAPPETPPAPPEQWQANAPDAATGQSLPNPNQPITEATGDGPPDDGSQPMANPPAG